LQKPRLLVHVAPSLTTRSVKATVAAVHQRRLRFAFTNSTRLASSAVKRSQAALNCRMQSLRVLAFDLRLESAHRDHRINSSSPCGPIASCSVSNPGYSVLVHCDPVCSLAARLRLTSQSHASMRGLVLSWMIGTTSVQKPSFGFCQDARRLPQMTHCTRLDTPPPKSTPRPHRMRGTMGR
jgi:hypothetical protein